MGEVEREAEEAACRKQRPEALIWVQVPTYCLHELHMLSFSVCTENCDK